MKFKKMFFLLLLGYGHIMAQAPADSVYQTPQSYEFTGSNSQTANLSDSYIEPRKRSFTLAMTIVPKLTSGTLQIIAEKGNGTVSTISGWTLGIEGNQLKFRVCGTTNTGNYRASACAPFPDATYLNQTVKIIATVDRNIGKVDLFINGSNTNTTGGGFGPTSNIIDANQDITNVTFPLYFGQRTDGASKFTGTISDVKIYTRTLSTAEIQAATLPTDYTYTTTAPAELTGSNSVKVLCPKFSPGKGSYTVLFKITPKATAATSNIQNIASHGNLSSGVAGWSLVTGEGYIGFRVCGTNASGNYKASARIPFPDATYMNQVCYGAAVVNRSSGSVEFYLNGNNAGVVYNGYGPGSNIIDASQEITPLNTSTFYLGQSSASTYRYTGTLHSLTLYKRALSLEEIRGAMNVGLTSLSIVGVDNFNYLPNQLNYPDLTTLSNVSSVTFTPFFDSNHTATINGIAQTSGVASAPIALTIGNPQTITLQITNTSSGEVKTYTFTVTRTTQSLQKMTVFTGGQEGYNTYRIPAIICAPNGDLLAFCEGRKNSSSDSGDIDLVMKRSTDNGQTWSANRILVDFKQLLAPDGITTYGTLYGDYTVGNMAPVVDMSDPDYPAGRIIMPFNTNGAESESTVMGGTGVRETWVITSADNGATWSTPKNITLSVSKPNEPSFNANYNFSEDWRWYAITPGHGTQLKKSQYAGRLVFPCNHSAGATGGTYFAHCFYSDDHGATWQLGNNVGNNMNESTGTELSNGNFMINSRNYDGTARRAVATSTDGGITWSVPYRDAQLPEPICQGTLLYNDFAKMTMFANPASTSSRSNLTVRASFDDGTTWAVKRTVEVADGAYSDLVLQRNNNVGLLYETSSYSKINYAIMNNDWILGGTRTSGSSTLGAIGNQMTNIVINGNIKNYVFDPATYTYTLQCDNATNSVTITPTAATGTIYVNGAVVNSGTASDAIHLEAGKEKFINVTVTETDKIPVNYFIKITRNGISTNVNQAANSNIKCYPNPTNRYIHILYGKNTPVNKITIYDVKGNLLFEKSDSTQIDLENYPNGNYLFKIQQGSEISNNMIILRK